MTGSSISHIQCSFMNVCTGSTLPTEAYQMHIWTICWFVLSLESCPVQMFVKEHGTFAGGIAVKPRIPHFTHLSTLSVTSVQGYSNPEISNPTFTIHILFFFPWRQLSYKLFCSNILTLPASFIETWLYPWGSLNTLKSEFGSSVPFCCIF